MKVQYKFYAAFLIIMAMLAGCSGSSTPLPVPEETRPQDARTFTISEAALPFTALTGSTVETDRWWGVLGSSGYRVEVPKTTWNGMLVMYAHGYSGTGAALPPTSMPAGLRRWLLDRGYAWAASSFSKNYYDVRAGVEDTNALALNFNSIAVTNGRPLARPSKIYIIGHSMGGHISAAAAEDEAFETAANKIRYNGAVPMCGVTGDMELFNYFVAAQLSAQKLAGFDATSFPVLNYDLINVNVRSALFTTFPTVRTAAGNKWKGVMMNLSGGKRPLFDQGFDGPMTATVWGTFGGDGTITGILNKQGTDTNSIIYRFTEVQTLTAEEYAFNISIVKATAERDANRIRRDGVRWVPQINGNFSIPVVSIHTLGDMYVPFRMMQIHFNRAQAGTGKNWLVVRAIRGIGHCDFTVAEQVKALEDMLRWDQQGVKPTGDDVITAATVANDRYGCAFTNNTTGTDDSSTTIATRASLSVLFPCP